MSVVGYSEEHIKTLEWREHIRLRPGMYIGKLGDGSSQDDGVYVLLKEVMDNAVDEYMSTSPESSIAQIARRFGFDDPLYFSRLYKKYRGTSPSHKKLLRRKKCLTFSARLNIVQSSPKRLK